jgi:hypothetical protein
MIPIILYTHSEYSFIWNATISLLQKYATGYEIYWFSDSLVNYVLPQNFIVCIYDPKLNWSLRLKKYINTINSDYFIYLQEDWLLIDTIDNGKVAYLVNYMKDNAIDFMMSYIRKEATFIEKSIYEGYEFFKIKGHFFQPAIWNKKLFMKILDLDISLKNYEEDIVNNITENAKCYSIIYTITNDVSIPTLYFPHMHAINKGKWTFIKYPCLKALIEEYDIDTSSRGIDTTWLTNFQ